VKRTVLHAISHNMGPKYHSINLTR